MEEDRGRHGGEREGEEKRDREAEIGDGPVSQTGSALLVFFEFLVRHQFLDGWTG